MSITLTYPIRETHENLALKKDRTVVAFTAFQILPQPNQTDKEFPFHP